MARMDFSVRQVWQQLRIQRQVCTVRSYELEEPVKVWVDGIGLCYRYLIYEITCKHELARWQPFSGFATLDEWWNVIQMFCKNKRMWLYVVRTARD